MASPPFPSFSSLSFIVSSPLFPRTVNRGIHTIIHSIIITNSFDFLFPSIHIVHSQISNCSLIYSWNRSRKAIWRRWLRPSKRLPSMLPSTTRYATHSLYLSWSEWSITRLNHSFSGLQTGTTRSSITRALPGTYSSSFLSFLFNTPSYSLTMSHSGFPGAAILCRERQLLYGSWEVSQALR